MKPTGRRIIITYDSQAGLKCAKCMFSKLLGVDEAITLIILSLIYANKFENKPTICMDKSKNYKEINVNYEKLDVLYLESLLFKVILIIFYYIF